MLKLKYRLEIAFKIVTQFRFALLNRHLFCKYILCGSGLKQISRVKINL